MQIAVVGAGALGLYYGAMLQRGGNDVRFLLRRDHDAIMRHGLVVRSVDGDFHLPDVKGYRSPGDLGEADLVVVGLKTFANDRFQELIEPVLGPESLILTLQNGLGNEETLAALFGGERVLGGVAFLCSNRGEPGVVHHLGEGRIILGEFCRGKTGKAEKIADVLRNSGVECRVTDDYVRARWEKLVWNIPFNGLCALMLKPVDSLLGLDATRRLILDIMGEVIDGANRQGLINELPATFAEKMVRFSDEMGPYRPSMLIDRLEGRALELESIFGAPLRAAEEKGIEMVRVRELYALLQLAVSG